MMKSDATPISTAASTEPGQGPTVSSLHGLLLAVAVAIFAWPIALPIGVAAGAFGAFGGSLLAGELLRRQFRLGAVIGSGVAILLLGRLVEWAFVDLGLFPASVGGSVALELADGVRWLRLAAGTVVILRGVAATYRAALAVEGGVVVIAVASTVAAHRDGMIARPLEVADWFWTQGIDPVIAFLGIGLVGAVLFAGIIAKARSPGRTLLQLLFVLALGLFVASRIHGLDSPERRDVVGGQGGADDKEREQSRKEAKAKAGQGQPMQGKPGEGQPSEARPNDSSFRNDDLPSPGGGAQQRPAAVVLFHKEASPSGGMFYFRHAAFSQFNGIRLVKTSRPDVDPDSDSTFPSNRRNIPGVHNEGKARTIVATDVALLVDHPKIFTLTDATAVGPLANPDPTRFRRAYRVASAVLTGSYEDLLGSGVGDPSWSDDIWAYYTELPSDERYFELAAELQAGLRPEYRGDPLARALVIKQYLEQNATYSFKRNYEGEDDPTAAFLFSEEKLGYCVHLAHAAAFLMRAMGLPSRVSAGYAVPSSNLGSGSALLIKQGDAHAWAEVYLQGVGWVPIEVTPEKTDVEPQEFSEQDLQQLLGEMARKQPEPMEEIAQKPRLFEMLEPALRAIPYLFALAILLAYAWKFWRLASPWLVSWRRQPKVAYRAALDRLSAAGLARSFGETRERFADRVEGVAPSFGTITELHVATALGSKQAWSSERRLEELPQLVAGVGRELRHAVPTWRWLLGLLNPISWLWSR